MSGLRDLLQVANFVEKCPYCGNFYENFSCEIVDIEGGSVFFLCPFCGEIVELLEGLEKWIKL